MFSLLEGTDPVKALATEPELFNVLEPPLSPRLPFRPVPCNAIEDDRDLLTERCISAKRTLSITCWVPPTDIRFETRSGA